jgi:probable phosphoglycerate mutase
MFLVLHGQTEWNRDGRVQGHSDSPLIEHGRRQALTVAQILRDRNIPAGACGIVCSPLGRTQETARIIASELGFDIAAIRKEELLKEISLGQWEGHTNAQVHSRWPDNMAGSDRYNWYFRSPDGETHDDVSKRLRKWLVANPDHNNLVVVTHGVASRILRGLYGGLTFEDALRLEVVRDAVFQLSNGRIAKLVAVNGES